MFRLVGVTVQLPAEAARAPFFTYATQTLTHVVDAWLRNPFIHRHAWLHIQQSSNK
jgi:hypothetical protein